MTRTFAAVLLSLGTAVAALPAGAQTSSGPQFTFTVPVRLAALPPEVTGYSVSCGVYYPLGGAGIMANGRTVGVVPIIGGALNTDVVVPVTVNTVIHDPAQAVEYTCSLSLTGPAAPGSPTPTVGTSYLDDSRTVFPLAAGAAFRQRIRAPLPR